jgi:hypothetical protein
MLTMSTVARGGADDELFGAAGALLEQIRSS